MYDGTACTAGLHQAIAVYPKELRHEDFSARDDQGSLWRLLRMIAAVPDFPEMDALLGSFSYKNWYLSPSGALRYSSDATVLIKGKDKRVKRGDKVYGFDIRQTFTPDEGSVPRSGPKWKESRRWALLFHAVFSNPKSYKAQTLYGQEHFHRYCKRKKLRVSGVVKTVGEWLYGGNSDDPSVSTEGLDLALSTFWSHSVNAPAKAWSTLKRSLARHDINSAPDAFAKDLLRRLGRSTYGRWNFSDRNGRWARTRLSAMRSGYWSADLFKPGGVMPRNL
ncbi:MAG: hypothetical protein DRI24_16325 [Deltaproteobacteria bacterium]|nr:MAG: hypothetical protein DRI24_16325 [Deltaproteobacteria bacterium]